MCPRAGTNGRNWLWSSVPAGSGAGATVPTAAPRTLSEAFPDAAGLTSQRVLTPSSSNTRAATCRFLTKSRWWAHCICSSLSTTSLVCAQALRQDLHSNCLVDAEDIPDDVDQGTE